MVIKISSKPVKIRVGRGTSTNIPEDYIDGFIWFAVDTGRVYIDAPRDGTLVRTCINPILGTEDLYRHYATKYDFPNIGESNYIYVDDSKGDFYVFGVLGAVYTSIGIANDDTIEGGDATGGI